MPSLARKRFVFIGDSNTDTEYRTRFQPHGYGYVMFVATMLAAADPANCPEIVNRGNDGDTVLDLARRWQRDAIDQAPDRLFVLIGTNDVAFRYLPDAAHAPVDDELFASTLSRLVAETRERTAARISLIEPMPYDLPPGIDQEPNHALARLCDRIAAIAREHDCGLVPVRAGLAAILAARQGAGWYQNFNHPAFPGHAYVAQQVLRHLGWQL